MDDLRCMTKSQRCKRSEKSGKSRKHQRDLQLRRPQPFNQGKPPLESPPPGGKERRLIGSRWDLHEAAAVTMLNKCLGGFGDQQGCRVSGSRTRPASQATQPRYSAIALGGVPIKKIRCTKGELAGNKIPFLLRPWRGRTGRLRLFSHGERQLLLQKLSIMLTRANAPAPERRLNPKQLDVSARRAQTRSSIRRKWKPPNRGGYMPDRLQPPNLSPSQIKFIPGTGPLRDRSPRPSSKRD